MPTKGERGKATDFSIAAIMAPRGPSFGHYHLQGIGNAAATANTSLECPAGKGFVAESALDNRESPFFLSAQKPPAISSKMPPFFISRISAKSSVAAKCRSYNFLSLHVSRISNLGSQH